MTAKKSKTPDKVMSGADIIVPKPMGRPEVYTEEFVEEILDRLSCGESLKYVCASDHLPASRTVWRWMRTHPDFRQKYERAKDEACEAMAEEMFDMAEDEDRDVQRSRLMVDTRKWYISKIKAKKYGDKIDTTITHKFSELTDIELDIRIKELENESTKH
tara:strand:- start:4866 stop:5345 length:480 start_codon:yes stop_codon:yes gene_type:complete